jgi:hypothetical protein
LTKRFPNLDAYALLQGYDKKNPDIAPLMEAFLPLIYSRPLLDAYLIAKSNRTHFMAVINPMLNITGYNESEWKKQNFASLEFQETCHQKLATEAKKLERSGLPVVDFNRYKDRYRREHFNDQAHLTDLGTTVTAELLFQYIQNNWR